MEKKRLTSPTRQKSRESSFAKSGQDSNQSSRPISQERQRRNTNGSRRSSVLALLPKTPPAARRYSLTPDRDNLDIDNPYVEERGADVASKATLKVSKFLDYYNEALRRRLERELLKPVTIPKASESENSVQDSDDNNSDVEDSGKTTGNWKKIITKTAMVTKIVEASQPPVARKTNFGSHALNQINKRKAIKKVKMLLRRIEVIKKFRKKARIIIFCIRCVKDHSFK